MFSPSQRNSVYKSIELQKQSPRDFTIESTDEWLKVIHKATGYHFRFQPTEVRTNRGNELWFYVYYTPSKQGVVFNAKKEHAIANIDTLEAAMPHFAKWLLFIKEEFEQPDLWAEMEHEPYLFDDAEVVTDEPFTQAEIKLLEARVPEVEQQIIDLDLPPDAQAAITAIVRRVPTKATRFTKKDLSDALVGSFVKVGFKWQLTTADIGDVWLVSQRFFTLALP
jgi:hypothetical protein